jgi:propanediol utilization protein
LIQLIDKVSAFNNKVLLWKRTINEGGEMNYFPRSQLFITENKIEFTANIVSVFERHLHMTSAHFEKYRDVLPENRDIGARIAP